MPMSPVAPTTATLALTQINAQQSVHWFSTCWQITQAVWVFPVVNRSHSRVVLRICLELRAGRNSQK